MLVCGMTVSKSSGLKIIIFWSAVTKSTRGCYFYMNYFASTQSFYYCTLVHNQTRETPVFQNWECLFLGWYPVESVF